MALGRQWIEVEFIMLSEISQIKKGKYYVCLICRIYKYSVCVCMCVCLYVYKGRS